MIQLRQRCGGRHGQREHEAPLTEAMVEYVKESAGEGVGMLSKWRM